MFKVIKSKPIEYHHGSFWFPPFGNIEAFLLSPKQSSQSNIGQIEKKFRTTLYMATIINRRKPTKTHTHTQPLTSIPSQRGIS